MTQLLGMAKQALSHLSAALSLCPSPEAIHTSRAAHYGLCEDDGKRREQKNNQREEAPWPIQQKPIFQACQ